VIVEWHNAEQSSGRRSLRGTDWSKPSGFDAAALAPSQPRNSEPSGLAGREDYGAAGPGALSDSWMLGLAPKGGWTGSGSTASPTGRRQPALGREEERCRQSIRAALSHKTSWFRLGLLLPNAILQSTGGLSPQSGDPSSCQLFQHLRCVGLACFV